MRKTYTQEEIQKIAFKCLGKLPIHSFIPVVKIHPQSSVDGLSFAKFEFDNKSGSIVYGYIFYPSNFNKRIQYPIIHYLHYHGGKYDLGKDELFEDQTSHNLLKDLLASGFIVVSVDAYGFGERRDKSITGEQEELTLAKDNLLYGRTLWGMMLRDEILLLNWVKSLKYVDKDRIGITGVSMGCEKALWLASLFSAYKATAGILCSVKFSELINTKKLDLHGIYFYPFGLLNYFDTEVLYSAICPRDLFLLNGENDQWSQGHIAIVDYLKKHYEAHNADKHFSSLVYQNIGHEFTESMGSIVRDYFIRILGSTT